VKIGRVGFVATPSRVSRCCSAAHSVQSGEPLDPIALANARTGFRDSGFSTRLISATTQQTGGCATRVYAQGKPRSEANLLFGYGSYEELRGGSNFAS